MGYLYPGAQWEEVFNFYGKMGKLAKIKVPLLERHQVESTVAAIQLFGKYCQLQHLPFKERDTTQGLTKVKWSTWIGRLSDEPLIVLNGAHNDHAVECSVENLCKELPQHTIHILFSALATKDVDEVVQDLKQVPSARLYSTSFDYPEVIVLTETEKHEDDLTEAVPLWQSGLGEILEKILTDDSLLVTGSLYLVSQVRELLLTIGGDDEEI